MYYGFVWKSDRTYKSSGYGHGSLTELTEVPGRYTNVVPVPVPVPGYFYKGTPVPRVLSHGHTELTEVSGTGMNVKNSQNFRVGVWMLYKTHRSVPGTGNTRVNTRLKGAKKQQINW